MNDENVKINTLIERIKQTGDFYWYSYNPHEPTFVNEESTVVKFHEPKKHLFTRFHEWLVESVLSKEDITYLEEEYSNDIELFLENEFTNDEVNVLKKRFNYERRKNVYNMVYA